MERRCNSHPHVVISSPCGMFDAVCGECEYACFEADERDAWEALPADEKAARIAAAAELDAKKAADAEAARAAYLASDIPF